MCICKTSIVIRTSGNLAAILDFEHTLTSHEAKPEIPPLKRLTPKT